MTREVRSSFMLACPSLRSSSQKSVSEALWGCFGSRGGQALNPAINSSGEIFELCNLFMMFHNLCVQVAEVCLPVHRNVSNGDCGSRPCCFWCTQHYCLCPSWQRPHLQPHLWPSHHCKTPTPVFDLFT